MTERKIFQIEEEILVKTYMKNEIDKATYALKILDRHAILIYDIALWIWRKEGCVLDMPQFIDYFMEGPVRIYQTYRSDRYGFYNTLEDLYMGSEEFFNQMNGNKNATMPESILKVASIENQNYSELS